ncbi:MAG: AAA family ATPase [Synergistaceae bacterium]|nr:AAA family ATPase [Synergistaceae bacterium]
MKELPIGLQDFEMLRRENMLYVDKTERLLELVTKGRRYFLSRPRRFGKSLTLSTLEAMFSDQAELFKGLSAEEWVSEQAINPFPVVRFDMSSLGSYSTSEELNNAIIRRLEDVAEDNELQLRSERTSGEMLHQIIRALYKKDGQVVILIDEYDKPILDNLSDIKKANEMREVLRSFYLTLKSCDKYLRFVMLTGISTFSKVGVFSALNNLEDISMDKRYGDIAGYTQQELEFFFHDWLIAVASDLKISRDEILMRLKNYYDGFSFDGVTRLYNPFSILQCLSKGDFRNYWYESGSPSFIINWMKEHNIQDPEEYRHIVVNGNDFISIQEIEQADAASLLYQSGYLTIEKKEEQLLTLDYPNKEVMNSLSSMYLKLVYCVEGYALLGNEIWKALRQGDITEIVRLYNIAIAGIPYEDYAKNRNEFWYRSLFIMLLRGAGIISYSEPHTSKGRADLVLQFQNLVVVLEFKFAKDSNEIEEKKSEGLEQLQNRSYAKNYGIEDRKIISAVLVANDENSVIIPFNPKAGEN